MPRFERKGAARGRSDGTHDEDCTSQYCDRAPSASPPPCVLRDDLEAALRSGLALLLRTFQDIQLWLNECGTRAYFQSNRGGNVDLYQAGRPGSLGDFSGIAAIPALNTTSQDMDIALSGDERYLVFSSDREGETHIYETSR